MKKQLLALTLLGTLTACGAPGSGFENPFIAPLTLQLTPSTVSLEPGGQTHVSVTAKSQNTVVGSPTIKAFGNTQVTATPDDSGFTVTAAAGAQPGTYSFNVTGTLRSGEGSAPFTVTVTEPKPDTAKLAFNPVSLSLTQGASQAVTLSLSKNGTVQPLPEVTLNVPSNLSVTQSGSTFVVSSTSSTVPGTYLIVANAAGQQATLTVQVTAKTQN